MPAFARLLEPQPGVARGPEPAADLSAAFRPLPRANPLNEARLPEIDPADDDDERTWDGVRAEALSLGGRRWRYGRTGEEVGAGFADRIVPMDPEGAVDGELPAVRASRRR